VLDRPGSIVLAWAVGWAGALGVLSLWFAAVPPSLAAIHLPAWVVVGALAFGLPAFVAARRAGSPAPVGEALAWTVVFAIGVVIVRAVLVDWNVAEPGEINAVTIDPSRRRTYYQTPRFPPELVLTVVSMVSGALVAGTASGLLRRAGPLRTVGLALTSVVAVLCAGFALVVPGPIVLHVLIGGAESVGHGALAAVVAMPAAGAISGVVGGAVVEWLSTLTHPSRHAP
jgi:hypothetical protein